MIVKLCGIVIFVSSLALLYYFEQTAVISHFHLLFWPAILLTLAGPIGLLLLSTDAEQLKSLVDFFRYDSISNARRHLDTEYSVLRQLGTDYYTLGPKAFHRQDFAISTHLARTLERLAIRVPIQDAYDLLERDRDQLVTRLEQCISLFTLGVRLAPSVGMLGTIIGMSQLLSHLKEPENIGASVSVALVTTFYGLFFSLALWTPLQNHLNRLLDLKIRSFEQSLHWLDLLQKRKPSAYLGDESAFVSSGTVVTTNTSEIRQ